MREGAFLFYPALGLSETFDSNVFATPSNTKSDLFTTLSPSLDVRSDWTRHAIDFSANGQFKWYASHGSEDVNNFSTNGSGRFDIESGSYILANAGYSLLHEDRSSPDAIASEKQPTQYSVTGGYLGYVHDEGRIGLHADSTVTSYSFNNNSTATGVTIPEHDRDRIEYVGALRASYEIIPQLPYQAFVRVLGNTRQYNSIDLAELAAFGRSARRNSDGWEADAGASMEITRLITGEIYAGYLQQYYESPLFKSPAGPAFGGNVLWNVTPLASIKASFSQSIAETTLIGASSSQETNVSTSVEYEMLRNVLLVGGVGYVRDDYQGVSRVDNTYGASGGVKYLLNRVWKATFDVAYTNRSSSAPGNNYGRTVASVGIEAGF